MSVTLHSSLGDIKVEVACDLAPASSKNFLALCAMGQYDGTSFHRVVAGFCAQGGDPTGTGKGGRAFNGQYQDDEFHSALKVSRAARSKVPRRRRLYGRT